MTDFLALLEPLANRAAHEVVGPITFRSQLHAPVTIDPFAPSPAKPGGFNLMRILKPEVELALPTGTIVLSPYGRPTAALGPVVVGGMGLVVLALVGAGGLAGRFMSGTKVALAGAGGLAALAWVASQGKTEDAG